MFGRDKPLRIFSPRRAAAELRRVEERAAGEYGTLYRGGRAKALERAEEVAIEKVEEAAARTEAEVDRDQAKVEANFWDKVKRVARQIPFLEDLIAAYYAMRDHDTPLQARAALVFGLLYFLWTFDIIPDFLGVIGYADDGTVITTILVQVSGSIKDEHRRKAREALGLEIA
ncbi:MAG: YkvA family protein [Oceanicaulis sp.]